MIVNKPGVAFTLTKQDSDLAKQLICNGSQPVPFCGCWIWLGVIRNTQGYGAIVIGGGKRLAHRVSYAAHLGPIPVGGVIAHKCDTPLCVNPDHLQLGTVTDNMRDMFRKERGRPWGMKIFTLDQVKAIRFRLDAGESQRSIAKSFKVHRTTIGKIKRGITWSSETYDAK